MGGNHFLTNDSGGMTQLRTTRQSYLDGVQVAKLWPHRHRPIGPVMLKPEPDDSPLRIEIKAALIENREAWSQGFKDYLLGVPGKRRR